MSRLFDPGLWTNNNNPHFLKYLSDYLAMMQEHRFSVIMDGPETGCPLPFLRYVLMVPALIRDEWGLLLHSQQ